MNDVRKNQHYVPQVYLKNFATKTKKDTYKLTVFDKIKNEVRHNQNIKNVASENYFYDVDFNSLIDKIENSGSKIKRRMKKIMLNIDPQTIEKEYFKLMENELILSLEKIISVYTMSPNPFTKDVHPFNIQDRINISYYLAIQSIRTLEFRETFIQSEEKFLEELIKKTLNKNESSELLDTYEVKVDEDLYSLKHSSFLMNVDMIESTANILRKHIWYVGINESKNTFWTSDNPFVRYGHLGEHGLKSIGIEIVFPISNNLALIIREARFFNSDLKKENTYVQINDETIRYYNRLQLIQCSRSVFSIKSDFNDASNFIDNHPEHRDLKRSRIEVL